jgi:hypothetical protein
VTFQSFSYQLNTPELVGYRSGSRRNISALGAEKYKQGTLISAVQEVILDFLIVFFFSFLSIRQTFNSNGLNILVMLYGKSLWLWE